MDVHWEWGNILLHHKLLRMDKYMFWFIENWKAVQLWPHALGQCHLNPDEQPGGVKSFWSLWFCFVAFLPVEVLPFSFKVHQHADFTLGCTNQPRVSNSSAAFTGFSRPVTAIAWEREEEQSVKQIETLLKEAAWSPVRGNCPSPTLDTSESLNTLQPKITISRLQRCSLIPVCPGLNFCWALQSLCFYCTCSVCCL